MSSVTDHIVQQHGGEPGDERTENTVDESFSGDQDEDDDEYEYEYEDDEHDDDDDSFDYEAVAVESVIKNTTTTTSTQTSSRSSKNDTSNNDKHLSKHRTPFWSPPPPPVDISERIETATNFCSSNKRLAMDLKAVMSKDTEQLGFCLSPLQEDSMSEWNVEMHRFDADSTLAKDMLVANVERIHLRMTFPDKYPFEPPFVRVTQPRFQRRTGYIVNGALCMELLTSDGWNPTNDIESVLVSVHSHIVAGGGRLEAVAGLSDKEYQERLQRTGKHKQLELGYYSEAEATRGHTGLSEYHKEVGWSNYGIKNG